MTLSQCCDAELMPDLDSEESHSWEDVANANLVCEVCGESEQTLRGAPPSLGIALRYEQ